MDRIVQSPKSSLFAAALLATAFTAVYAYSHEVRPPDGELFGETTQALDVLVLEAEAFSPVSGVTLRMCPAELANQPQEVLQQECTFAVADTDGRARFEDLQTREYDLRAVLGGFAGTSVGPLGIGDMDPRAPREVVVLLNPICWHC